MTVSRSTYIAACAAVLVLGPAASAQTYPVKSIRVVIPQQAGGSTDTTLRLQIPHLESRFGKSVIVDNRPGATGLIGTQIVSIAPPDGYTLLYNASNMLISQIINPDATYNVLRDFVPITATATSLGNLLVVHPSVPAHSVRELIALAKDRTNRNNPLKYGTQGAGSGQHVLVEMFNIRAGTSLMHVPYKGVPAIINAALSGEVDVLFINPITVLPHVKSGRLRVLGYTGSSRLSSMPEVPTLSESGLAGFDNPQASWHGWFAPAKTPNAIVMTIYTAVQEALQQPKVRSAIEAGGYRVEGGYTPVQFRKHIESELKRIAEIAHAARISTR